eukprot:CAMPEP_0170075320 /NCGR_PEP_ID=MMETSP0019_2-20121128/12471_1 /TAXON_ID=98059 /ORGANISM="Dinobryon sp., Strain UTEXLB2267" /LENGTH=321 /DNA_ID=CAMNT_0010286199 /DNA_START=1003 /DNA_END=1965 /DNA_ORIENTATION=+
MENREELTSRIVIYEQQLQQVNQLLQLDAQNLQFLKLKEDLEKVIHLTTDLIKQTNANSGSSEAPKSESDDDENGNDDSDDEQNVVAKTGKIEVGEVIEASSGERVYAGVVTGIINETECRIKYFEFESEVSLPVSSFQRAPPATVNRSEVKIGFKCQCKYATDQNYYDAVVTAVTMYGYLVTYSQYGNSEEVPLEYLKHLPNAPKKAQNKKWDGKSLIPIPDNLKYLPTDTEEEKLRKKKKMKAIKSKNRLITKEVEVTAVQQTWQKFVTKKATKKVTSLSAAALVGKKHSMFKSPDVVDGKVGVTNSGKGMTTFAERKK